MAEMRRSVFLNGSELEASFLLNFLSYSSKVIILQMSAVLGNMDPVRGIIASATQTVDMGCIPSLL